MPCLELGVEKDATFSLWLPHVKETGPRQKTLITEESKNVELCDNSLDMNL